jgi:hypothetical protein
MLKADKSQRFANMLAKDPLIGLLSGLDEDSMKLNLELDLCPKRMTAEFCGEGGTGESEPEVTDEAEFGGLLPVLLILLARRRSSFRLFMMVILGLAFRI